MRIWRRRLQNGLPIPAVGVRLYFGLSRGRLVRGFVTGQGGRPKREHAVSYNGIEFLWDGRTLDPGAEITIAVCYRGEPPPWGRTMWIPEEGRADLQRESDVSLPLAQTSSITTPARFAHLRQAALDEQQDILRHQRFFHDLDCETTPDLFASLGALSASDANARRAAVIELQPALKERTLARGRGLSLAVPGIVTLPPYANRSHVELISGVMRRIMLAHYPEAQGGDVTGLERAFELFSCGRLRIAHVGKGLPLNGEPNSAMYFLFAEFALLAADMNVDKAFWESLLNVLVRTQRLYVGAYGPSDPSEKRWGIYGECALQLVSDETIAGIRTEFASIAHQDLMGRAAAHAHDAFQL